MKYTNVFVVKKKKIRSKCCIHFVGNLGLTLVKPFECVLSSNQAFILASAFTHATDLISIYMRTSI